MKKIIGSLAIASLFLTSSTSIFAASAGGTFDVPSGGACGITADCAAGLTCNSSVCVGGGTLSGSTAPGGTLSGSTAAGGGLVPVTPLQNPIRYDTFSDFVAAVLQTAVEILMPFVVLAFIWSGFLFVKAQGNPEELKTAKQAIYWSIIGAFILMGAWGFAQIISTTISTLTRP